MTTDFPYPGLRSFHQDETDIFFGREAQVDQLLERLSQSRFLAVIGPSGCGKSSLVRAGLIPSLEAGFVVSAGASWSVAEMRPGSQPLKQLSTALLKTLGKEKAGDDALAFLNSTLRRGPFGLVEVLKETPLPEQTNLLLLVDQFEEVFRFREEGDSDEADAFISLLIKCAEQSEVPIYVVITMRSDFLGDCAVFTGLPEVMNECQFLTPRLTREENRTAIIGPARVFEGNVDEELVNNLLNDIGSDPDQLPLMQHLMMRMWTQKSVTTKEDKHPLQITLTYSDYEVAGGMTKALSNHADEAYRKLDEEQKKIAEAMFRCLSERSSEKRDTRHPVAIKIIAAVTGTSVKQVEEVVEVFRHPDCNFLTPAFTESLYPESIIDISHESLIRQWERMNVWVEQEAKSAETYRLLEQTAHLWRAGKAALWGSPNLENALDWKEREKPGHEWAKRYGENFKLVMEFLNASEKEYKKKEVEEERRRQQELEQAQTLAYAEKERAEAERQRAETQTRMNWWLRRLVISLVVALFVLGAIAYWYLDGYVWEHVTFYNTFTKQYGIAKGVGELTSQQVRGRAVSFKFIHKGRYNPVYKVIAVNNVGELTPSHYVGTYLKLASEQKETPFRECQWEFVLDPKGKIVYEKAYNKYGQLVWGLVYSPSIKGMPNHAHFVGPDGFPRPQRNSAAEFVKIEYSEQGYEIANYYVDRNDTPQPGPDGGYGRLYKYDERGLSIETASLDSNGELMNDKVGNAIIVSVLDGLGNIIEATAFDKNKKSANVKDGYCKVAVKYDDRGNPTELVYFDTSNNPTLIKYGYYKSTYRYDDRGNKIETIFFDTQGKPIFIDNGYHKFRTKYNNGGKIIEETYFDTSGNPVLCKGGYQKIAFKYDDRGNQIEWACFDISGKPCRQAAGNYKTTFKYDDRGNQIEWACFDTSGSPTILEDGYHRSVSRYDERGNRIEAAYFDTSGNPTTHTDGNHKYTARYDERGNKIGEAYFDTSGNPTLIQDGLHKFTSRYDKRGNRIEMAYFDTSGSPTTHKDGNHKYTARYDELGNRIEEAYFDTSGNPTLIQDGNHKYTARYDERGNQIEKAYFDTLGNPTLIQDGYHKCTARYDENENQIEQIYFDTSSKPVLHTAGYHKATSKYDDRGNQIEWAGFDTSGKPTFHIDGYHKVTSKYDERGKIIEVAMFLLANKAVSKFDDNGNIVETAYFDNSGNPILHTDGCHKFFSRYDDRGNQIEETYFDTLGKPALRKAGYHKASIKYDEHGNQIEWAGFDTSGKPVLHTDGYHKVTSKYDEHGNQIEWACFDTSGKPALHIDGYHKVTSKYDERGKIIETAMFLLANKIVSKLDDSGNTVEMAYFDNSSNPILHTDGYHKYTTMYNDEGKRVKTIYLDVNGEEVETEVIVTSIITNSQAETIGLNVGDVFVSYDGKPVSDMASFIYHREAEPQDVPAKELLALRDKKRIRFMLSPGKIGVYLSDRVVREKRSEYKY
ncbi:MAG: AAA family ATPase [Candidatus Brocadiaceae bacterium]|nr:AAA family ATPase [Candidatus Brocadiaceae bacterium]